MRPNNAAPLETATTRAAGAACSSGSSCSTSAKWPVVDAELQFESIGRAPLGRHHHTGIADQQIELLMVRAQLGGSGRHRGKIRQIQGQPLQRSGGSRRLDALDGLLSPLLITATQQHMGTLAGELQGSLKPTPCWRL